MSECLEVCFERAPGNANDWITLTRVEQLIDSAEEDFGDWAYLDGQIAGCLSFTEPATSVTYEVRIYLDNGYTLLATSRTILIQP